MDGERDEAARDEPGNMIDDRGVGPGASASRTGTRQGDDTGDIGGTDEMGASTGGLAGTSR